MSDAETLKDLITKSRDSLATAQEIADRTVRPHNVCDGHDALFGLVKAIAGGVDTSLTIQAGRLTDTQAQPNGMGKQPAGEFWPQFWAIAREKASLIIICATAIIIAAIAFDRLEKLTAAWKEVRQEHASSIPYDPPPN
jgi:hypothetical protein